MPDPLRSLRPHWHMLRGERVALLPQRALWWPARATLIVADLHLGKSEAYRALGVPVPEGIGPEAAVRLQTIARACGAKRVVVLGDLMHSLAGLTPSVRTLARGMLAELGAEVVLVRGNHDIPIDPVAAEWGIALAEAPLEEGPFVFAHQPVALRGRYVLAGHLHPTFTLASATDSLRLPCFHFGPRMAVLPAFSAFSRGVPMTCDAGDSVFVIADGEVVEASAARDPGGAAKGGSGSEGDDDRTAASA